MVKTMMNTRRNPSPAWAWPRLAKIPLSDTALRPRSWSLSTKLTTAYACLTLAVAGALATGMYLELRQVQRQAIRTRLQEILSLAQPQIDSDFHALIVTPEDEESSYYQVLQERLAAIRQASDHIHHIYTLRETPDGQIVTVLNSAPASEPQAPIGSPVQHESPLFAQGLAAIQAPVVDSTLFATDSGEMVLHGYAPIIDPLGRQEGVLTIELEANEIITSEARARNLALLAFAIALPLALGGGQWLTRRLTAPISELVAGVEEIAAGNLTQRVNVRSHDEVGTLAARFNAMSDRLQESFETLEAKVAQRTQELTTTNDDLQATLKELQHTQSQLIQAEKMLGLGQMVAGIAHEINNPIGFIHSNLHHVQQYSQTLLNALAYYHQAAPQLSPERAADLADEDLDFIAEDFPRILHSMRNGTQRIRDIVLALRNFSRLGEAQIKAVDLRDGLESALLMVQHRLHGEKGCPSIQVIREYREIPLVECYPDQLNQVFLNLISNAIDALQASRTANPVLKIWVSQFQHQGVRVAIADNGPGMTAKVQQQIFNPFFTTKPVGQGTGLGLATSYTIVVNQHGGAITCDSAPGRGTTFYVDIPHRLPAAGAAV